MNILIDALPDTVLVNGVEYPVRTDYRASLRTILAFEDDTLTMQEKQAIAVKNLFLKLPGNTRGVVEAALLFLNGGASPKDAGEEDKPRLYSFGKDANYIFAAYRQTHRIDLSTADLHWWTFLALFMDLGSDTTFCQLTSLRKRVKTGKASKEERQIAREMGEAFDIPEPDTRTLEEKEREAEFMRLVEQGQTQ